MKLVGVALALALVFASAAAASAAPPRAATVKGDQCVTCHRGIEEAHPKKPVTCTTCHRGDAKATEATAAHAGMFANPSDLRVVEKTCGAGGCHQSVAVRVKANIMAHRSGTQSGTLFPNG